ncbi:hypothetical protein [Agrococcus casei]|uniref:hypothetical protein n=1 Tax=Agrococcus casei TaxID=343512 RepID=UPI003F930264
MISQAVANQWISSALKRLEASTVPFAAGKGWGLGFRNGQAPADEPYLVTTAVVAAGLRNAAELTLESASELTARARLLRDVALTGMATWMHPDHTHGGHHGTGLPYYSPSVPIRIFNAVALALAEVLLDSPYSEAEVWRRYESLIQDEFIPDVGWPYSTDSQVVDLVHQAFIIDSFQIRGISQQRAIDDTLLVFATPFGYVDAGIAAVSQNAANHGRLEYAVQRGETWVHRKPSRARVWSLGAHLLVLANALPGDAEWAHQSRTSARSVAAELIASRQREDDDWKFPRQSLFAAVGILALVAREREARTAQKSPASTRQKD